MSGIRGVKDRRFKFVQLLNSMFEDPNISLKAKGLIGFCLTKPENWTFHVAHLASVLKEGERAIYSTLDELQENGYAIRYQPRKENGDFAEWETIISDSKEEIALLKEEMKNHSEFQKIFTLRCFAVPQVALSQNVSLSNNKEEKYEKTAAAIELPEKKLITAAAFPKENSQTQSSDDKSYPCLDDLNLDAQTKIQLTKLNPEDKIIEAIKVYRSRKKLPDNLGAFLQWCCNHEIKAPSMVEDVAKENKSYAEKIIKKLKHTKEVTLEILSKHVEFVFPTCQKNPIIIEYKENGFKSLIHKYIKEYFKSPHPLPFG